MTNKIRTQLTIDNLRNGNPSFGNVPALVTEVETISSLVHQTVQEVDEIHSLVDVGSVTDDAMLVVRNLSTTETIEIGGDDTGDFVPWLSIPPGFQPAILPLAASLAGTYLKATADDTPALVTLYKIESEPGPEPEPEPEPE